MQQARYIPAEQALLRSVNMNIRQSEMYALTDGEIHDRQQDGIGYDENMNKITPFTYLIIGETNSTAGYRSQGRTEDIAVTFHLYHRSDRLAVMDDTRGLLDKLQYHAEQLPVMDNYTVEKIRMDTKQTLLDVDAVTIHGVLRMTYTVKHKLRY